jgi:hypothetical protein
MSPNVPVQQAAVGTIAAETVADARFRRRVERFHAQGPRLTAELLAQVAADRSLGGYLDALLDRFLALDPETLRIVGADRMPPTPIHTVGRRRP